MDAKGNTFIKRGFSKLLGNILFIQSMPPFVQGAENEFQSVWPKAVGH
jgi:hypothetical protein